MRPAPSPLNPFDLKSTAWLLTSLRLHTAEVEVIAAMLDERFGGSPGLFDDDALVLDLSPLREADATIDFPALLAHLRRHRLLPLAVQGGSAAQMAAGQAAGLSQATEPEGDAARTAPAGMPAASSAAPPVATAAPPAGRQSPPVLSDETSAPGWADTVSISADVDAFHAAGGAGAAEAAETAETAETADKPAPTLVIDRPLRSGQRVYARGGDLVVLQAVSVGAEVIADGHIHVYAPLRGRAMAGARGDTRARIFSPCMQAQLVSIAGIYRTTETPLSAAVEGRPAHVRLDGNRLLVEPLAP
ncbi:MAG: septum site-determining protein MinC [Rubrivivax sp.]|nr:septum site-determining protein MinC [Rubrivivax sp.]